MSKDIKHFYTTAGEYDDDHKVEQKEYDNYSYVYVDVETDAETPQEPIFAFAYDPVSQKCWIGVAESKTKILNKMTRDDIKDTVKSQVKKEGYKVNEIKYYPYISEKYLESILDEIKGYNDEMEDHKKGICGHNVFFDIGMLSSEDEDLIGDAFQEKQVDGVMSAGKFSISHKRAGAYGRLYQFKENLQDDYDISVCDTMTVAKSMRKKASLDKLTEYYDINNIKIDDEEHGKLNKKYIKYNVNDVISTMIVQEKLSDEIRNTYNINKPMHYIFSSASLAKAKMTQMNYDRVIYTEKAKEICSKAYFGGQTEALKVGKMIDNVDYTDILSEYPTVAALTGVWEYMQCDSVGIKEIENTELPDFNMKKLKTQEFWKEIHKYYVVVDADNSKLPVRTDLNKETTRVYKANVTTDENVIYNYMDYIGACLLSDEENIEIKQSFKVFKEGEQDLDDTTVGGTKIKGNENTMQRLIEERKRVQYEENGGDKDENTQALKVTSNSLYGCSAERLEEQVKDEDGNVVERYDKAGKFYSPHVASVLTAGGRLLLSMGEKVAKDNGGEMYYCDTDSLIIDSSVTNEVQACLNNLNPYDGKAGQLDVLEIEDEDGEELSNVSLFAIDVKKYAIIKDNEIVTAKQHGLGHYNNMRDKDRVYKFWRRLINNLVDVDLDGPKMKTQSYSEVVKWQTAASTYRVRRQMSNLVNKIVKYGDFIQRTIARDEMNVVYLSTSLENEKLIKVDSENNSVEIVESIETENCKNIGNIVIDWISRCASSTDGRKDVTITDTENVSKESKSIIDAYDNQMQDTLENVNISSLID